MTKTREYAERTKAHIDRLAGEIEHIQSRKEQVMEDLRVEYERKLQEVSAEYDRQLQDLHGSEKDLAERLEKIRVAGSGALDEMKAGADLAIADMKNAVARAKEKFREI